MIKVLNLHNRRLVSAHTAMLKWLPNVDRLRCITMHTKAKNTRIFVGRTKLGGIVIEKLVSRGLADSRSQSGRFWEADC